MRVGRSLAGGEVLVSQTSAQLCPQLAHAASYGWWKGDGGSPFHQPQLAAWASCGQSCALVCDTKTSPPIGLLPALTVVVIKNSFNQIIPI